MTDYECVVAAVALINNLSDYILWRVTGLPIGEWMAGALKVDFDTVIGCITNAQKA